MSGNSLFGWLMLLGFAAVLGWFGFGAWRRARLIADTPTAKLRGAPQGYVELQGRAQILDGVPNIAPLTQKPCVWWRYRIERRGSKNRWSTVERGESDAIFGFTDDTGSCVVDPDGAEVKAGSTQRWHGISRYPGSAGRGRSGWLSMGLSLVGGRYRYSEERIIGNEPMYLIGWFRSQQDALDYDKRQALRERLAALKRDKSRLMQFDADGNGEIDQDEWEAAREAMAREVDEEHASLALQDALDIMARPPDGRPFVLAVGDAQKVLRRFRWQAALFNLAALVAAAVAITGLVYR